MGMGEPLNAFRVNEAAAEVGRSEANNMSPKSNTVVLPTPQHASVTTKTSCLRVDHEGELEGRSLEWYVSVALDAGEDVRF